MDFETLRLTTAFTILAFLVIAFILAMTVYLIFFSPSNAEARELQLESEYGKLRSVRKLTDNDGNVYKIQRREIERENSSNIINLTFDSKEIDLTVKGYADYENFNLKEKLLFKRMVSLENNIKSGNIENLKADIFSIQRIQENEYL